MTGSHKRIEEEIASLEEAIARLAQDFDNTYENYLTTLGKAVRQHLILACYHLCTQGYPEFFLKLSYSQRQKFQQNLQTLATNFQKTLLSLVQLSSACQAIEEKAIEEDDDDLLQTLASEDGTLELSEDVFVQLSVTEPLTCPERLAQWQENLERSIQKLLKSLSQDVNIGFKQAAIFPQHLPNKVLEAASQAEASAETVASPPNLLNLVIQTEEGENESAAKNVTRLIVVHLRLSEIEFADTQVMSARNQIRTLSAQLNKLGRSYQKKQREQRVLEAEAAWRSSWFEEKD